MSVEADLSPNVVVESGILSGSGTVIGLSLLDTSQGTIAPGVAGSPAILTSTGIDNLRGPSAGTPGILKLVVNGFTTAGTDYSRLACSDLTIDPSTFTIQVDVGNLSGSGTAAGVITTSMSLTGAPLNSRVELLNDSTYNGVPNLKANGSDFDLGLSSFTEVGRFTRDFDGNGHIDRIAVTMSMPLNDDFSVISAVVQGYTVTSIDTGGIAFDHILVIHLQEKIVFDTGVTPLVSVTNSSLKDATGYALLSLASANADDGADPILAAANYLSGKLIQVIFSEPIQDTWSTADVVTTGSLPAIDTNLGPDYGKVDDDRAIVTLVSDLQPGNSGTIGFQSPGTFSDLSENANSGTNGIPISVAAALYWNPPNPGLSKDANLPGNWSTDPGGTAAFAGSLSTFELRFDGSGPNADSDCIMTGNLTCLRLTAPASAYPGTFSDNGFNITVSEGFLWQDAATTLNLTGTVIIADSSFVETSGQSLNRVTVQAGGTMVLGSDVTLNGILQSNGIIDFGYTRALTIAGSTAATHDLSGALFQNLGGSGNLIRVAAGINGTTIIFPSIANGLVPALEFLSDTTLDCTVSGNSRIAPDSSFGNLRINNGVTHHPRCGCDLGSGSPRRRGRIGRVQWRNDLRFGHFPMAARI